MADRNDENKAMTRSQAGHLGGEAKHKCRGRECDEAKKTENESNENKMTRSEAGHLGGVAPHKCRGFQCDEKEHKSRK